RAQRSGQVIALEEGRAVGPHRRGPQERDNVRRAVHDRSGRPVHGDDPGVIEMAGREHPARAHRRLRHPQHARPPPVRLDPPVRHRTSLPVTRRTESGRARAAGPGPNRLRRMPEHSSGAVTRNITTRRGTCRIARHASCMLVRMINRDPAVNRRRVLLAVGGASLISALVPRLHEPRPAGPGPPRGGRRPQPGHGRPDGGQARPAAAPAYPFDRPLYYIDGADKAIALTIDDGPSPVYTPQMLDLLAEYHVAATFSMIGIHVAAYPYLARAVAEAGHRIANHTWTH